MKYLITGATGLVGGALTKKILEQGDSVHYLTTSPDKIKIEENYKGFYWNPVQGELDSTCLEGVDVIVNLAGESVFQKWNDEVKKRIMSSRVEGTALLYRTLRDNENAVKHVINGSAIGIYPDSETPLHESDVPPIADNFLGEVVAAWEGAADAFQELNVKISKIRIGIVLAEEGGALEQMAKPVRYGVGSGLGDGKQWQSWIALDDLVGIIMFAADNAVEGPINCAAPHPVRNRELIKKIGYELGRPVFLPNVPAFALKAVLGEMAEVALSSQNASSVKIQHAGYKFKYPKIEQALAELL